MALAPTNPDLPSSWMIPGIYFKLNLAGSGASLNSVQKRLLILGCKTSSGSKPANTPIQVFQQSDVNTFFGAGSEVARMYAAAISQVGPGVCDVFCMALDEPSSGTAATHLITFATNATASGGVDVYICGYKTSVAIASGDTTSTVATNVSSAINVNTSLPVTASPSSGTVTLTAKHKGVNGNDLPIIVNMLGSTGMTASPGTLALSGTASGSGSYSVTVGGTTMTATVAGSDTASVVGDSLVAAINGGGNPITATNSSGTLTFFYVTDRVVHRFSKSADGNGLTGTFTIGTAGVGAPTLTTALAVAAGQTAFPVWVTSFTDSTSLGAIVTHIELYANGLNQKGQFVHIGDTNALATAGAVPTAPTPALTTSPRYNLDWCVDSPQQGYELAARTAAIMCVEDYHSKNYDGQPLTTRGTVPLLMPHRNSRPAPSDINSAMYTYHMTPLAVDDPTGNLRIVRAMTTVSASDQRQFDWSWVRTFDFYRYDLNIFLSNRFSGKSLKLTGTPKTPNTVTINSIKESVYERLLDWDDADLFDDPESLKSSIVANQDPVVPSRVDVFVPARPPINLHQISGVIGAI